MPGRGVITGLFDQNLVLHEAHPRHAQQGGSDLPNRLRQGQPPDRRVIGPRVERLQEGLDGNGASAHRTVRHTSRYQLGDRRVQGTDELGVQQPFDRDRPVLAESIGMSTDILLPRNNIHGLSGPLRTSLRLTTTAVALP